MKLNNNSNVNDSKKNDVTVGEAIGNITAKTVDGGISLGKTLFSWAKEKASDMKAAHEKRQEERLKRVVANMSEEELTKLRTVHEAKPVKE